MTPRFFALLLVLSIAGMAVSPLCAQSPDSPDLFSAAYPEAGRWGPRDGSRTGLFLDIQNGIVAGLYAGYDADGNPIWAQFGGPLDPWRPQPGEPQSGWVLESELGLVFGGGCFPPDLDETCIPDTPTGEITSETIGRIELVFSGRNEATVEVFAPSAPNGPPALGPLTMAPLTFGVTTVTPDPAHSLRTLPNLAGMWAAAQASVDIAFTAQPPFFAFTATAPDDYHTDAGIIRLGPRELTEFDLQSPQPGDVLVEIRHLVEQSPFEFIPEGADLLCQILAADDMGGTERPRCRLDFTDGPEIITSIDDRELTDSRFVIRAFTDAIDTATSFELFRLDYD